MVHNSHFVAFVPLEDFSLIWRRHHNRWTATHFDLHVSPRFPVAEHLAVELLLTISTTWISPDRGSNPDLPHTKRTFPLWEAFVKIHIRFYTFWNWTFQTNLWNHYKWFIQVFHFDYAPNRRSYVWKDLIPLFVPLPTNGQFILRTLG